MREELINRRVEIEDAPDFAAYLIGQAGHICRTGGFGVEPDEVCVKLSNGIGGGYFYIDQLKFIDEE